MDFSSEDISKRLKDGAMDYYSVLNCSRQATYDELKRSYKNLVLKWHPDKCNGVERENFLLLSEVWRTLSDPLLKKEYDQRLEREETLTSHVVYDSIKIEDMLCDSVTGMHSYDCRCGGVYQIAFTDLTKGETVVPCEDCSMAIVVKTS